MTWYPIRHWRGVTKSSMEMYNDFVSVFVFDKVGFPFSIDVKRLLLKTPPYKGDYHQPPYSDHARVFKRTGTDEVVFVYHPYFWDAEYEKRLDQWCNDRDLRYIVCPREKSFYNPGNTFMILIMSGYTYLAYTHSIPGFPKCLQE